MEILRAQEKDIDSIEKIYESVHNQEEKGPTSTGWVRNVYPVRKTAEDSVKRNDMFVMVDNGKIVAAAIINQIQVPDYKYAKWKYDAKNNEVMVLHTLVVDPSEKNKGYGKAFVAFYEEYAGKQNCTELRLDTNAKNKIAQKMYQSLGYKEAGIVQCEFNGISGVNLICLEKYLG